MLLDTEFVKLPLRLDADRLANEANDFSEPEWRPHAQGFAGNSAVPLIAVQGNAADDTTAGPMRPTKFLERGPILQQVLASLNTVFRRTRLMRISGESEVGLHVDTNYYWLNHVRVHIPAITYPQVKFTCNGKAVHMAAGEVWVFNSWKLHNVLNPVTAARVHLVADTVGSAHFWDLVDHGERPFDPRPEMTAPPRDVVYEPGKKVQLAFESVNTPVVMGPWEQRILMERILSDVSEANPDAAEVLAQLSATLLQFNRYWRSLWARFGTDPSGFAAYGQALKQFESALKPMEGNLSLPNKMEMVGILRQALIIPALNPHLAKGSATVGDVSEMSAPLPESAAPSGAAEPQKKTSQVPAPATQL